MQKITLTGYIFKILEPQEFANGNTKQSIFLRVTANKYNEHYCIDFLGENVWMAKEYAVETKVQIEAVLKGNITKDLSRCFHNLEGVSIKKL